MQPIYCHKRLRTDTWGKFRQMSSWDFTGRIFGPPAASGPGGVSGSSDGAGGKDKDIVSLRVFNTVWTVTRTPNELVFKTGGFLHSRVPIERATPHEISCAMNRATSVFSKDIPEDVFLALFQAITPQNR